MRKQRYRNGAMRIAPYRLITASRKLLFVLLSITFSFFVSAQQTLQPEVIVRGELVKSIPSLRNLRVDPNFKPRITRDETGLHVKKTVKKERVDYGTRATGDPVVQKDFSNARVAAPSALGQNYDGMSYTNVSPADPTMATGTNHVIQMINGSQGSYVKIWDKSGAVALDQIYMYQLFTVPGYSGAGDPVVLYDQFSGRYIITEFGESNGVTTFVNTLIIAVSQSNDPTGGWNVYKYVDNSFFVDYPHYGVWPNALYATSNDFNTAGTAYLGSSVYAFDKNAMVAGAPSAVAMRTRLTSPVDIGSIAPVSISGSTPPPAGSPGLFLYYNDDNWTPEADVDYLRVLRFQPDFVTPANSVITLGETINTAPFKSGLCNFARNCIPSAGGSYDAISDRIMNRIYYRNFGTHESLVLNHTVDANYPSAPQKAGLRWYELRRAGGVWGIHQQATYAPDANHRWMGTIGINSLGQVALGYNRSSAGSFASVYFTGRNDVDPLSTISTPEKLVVTGTAYGTFSNRWGDYNDMATDRTDDVTFWMTAMYGGAAAQWKTRVASFTIGDACPVITLSPAWLPNFNYNQAYTATITAAGGAAPYTFAVLQGALPPGLSLNTSTGDITGTSTATTTYNFTVIATDVNGCVATKAFELANNNVFTTATFCNANPIAIPSGGIASPYPSTINVSGVSGQIGKVTVTLKGLSHTFPSDIDILLVGPSGQRAIILSDVGGGTDVSNLTLTLDDDAIASLTTPLSSGTYKPTNVGASDPFPAPAPGTTANSTLSVFNSTTPNGTWSLYVQDDENGDLGSIAQGWCINIATLVAPQITCPQNITVAASPGTCNATVSLTGANSATATGNPSPVITYSVNGHVIASPYAFPQGTTTVTATAANGVALDATCTFTVTVNPATNPALIADAFVLPAGVVANTVYIGYAPASSITLVAQPSFGTPPYTYSWSTGGTSSSITVSPKSPTTYTVTITSSDGCKEMASKQINVIDVRCGNKMDKVIICQVPPDRPSNSRTICVNGNAVADQLASGSYLGACVASTMTVERASGSETGVTADRLTVQSMPNPSADQFTIITRSKDARSLQVRIINSLGKLVEVRSNMAANGSLTLGQNYRPGIYYAEVIQGKEKVTVKLVKSSK